MHKTIPPPPLSLHSATTYIYTNTYFDIRKYADTNTKVKSAYIQITHIPFHRILSPDYIITDSLPFTEGKCVTTPTTRPKRSKPSNPSIIIHIPINGIAKLREEKTQLKKTVFKSSLRF